ncbi:MAG TPA: hypothetical protein VJT08_12330 [Terriglobales bacterium]|nr:hypothetical protein [Terriglobales bacterium]
MFKRTRYQFGCVVRKSRKKGPDVWALRYREHGSAGTIVYKSAIVGTVGQYTTESNARRAAQILLLKINAENPNAAVVTFGAVIDRYLAEELPNRHSTARGYQCWLKNHIRPKWGEYPIDQIKPVAVEQWRLARISPHLFDPAQRVRYRRKGSARITSARGHSHDDEHLH